MADATYQQGAIRREQGNNKLAVGSAGTLAVESGGSFDLESGSTGSWAGNHSVTGTQAFASGGVQSFASGAYQTFPVQTLGTSQVATNITNFGLTVLTGSTTGPTYTLAAPVAGIQKELSLSASSSGATHRAIVNSNSTAVSFDTTGGNQITLATSALRGIRLTAQTSAKWRIVGIYSGASIAAARST